MHCHVINSNVYTRHGEGGAKETTTTRARGIYSRAKRRGLAFFSRCISPDFPYKGLRGELCRQAVISIIIETSNGTIILQVSIL